MGMVLKFFKWIWATYQTLSLIRWLIALPVGIGGMGAVPVIGFIADWPLWLQALASMAFAIFWILIMTWLLNILKRKDKNPVKQIEPTQEAQTQQGNIQQVYGSGNALLNVAGGDLYQAGRDIKITPPTQPELNSPSMLELVFDPTIYRACRMNQSTSKGGTMYRVGVRVTGNQSIEDVSVSLKEFSPNGAEFLPVPLRPMNSGGCSFTVNPGDTPEYVDVVYWLPGSEMSVRYCQQPATRDDWPNRIPVGKYKFTLLAKGKDTAPCERDFVVHANEQTRDFEFYPAHDTIKS